VTKRIAYRSYRKVCAIGASLPGLVAIALLAIYQRVISPLIVALIGPACRFEPTCSEYAAQAIRAHGATRGGWIAIKRFLCCRPGSGWGYDPVGRASHNQGRASQTRPPIGAAAAIKSQPSPRGGAEVGS